MGGKKCDLPQKHCLLLQQKLANQGSPNAKGPGRNTALDFCVKSHYTHTPLRMNDENQRTVKITWAILVN